MLELWSNVLAEVQNQIRPDVYRTWFLPIDCAEAGPDRVVMSVPDDFYVAWFEDNYGAMLADILERQLKTRPELHFHAPDASADAQPNAIGLDPQYGFDNFVVGDSNKFAQAAAMGVASRPGKSYNPLFIYGTVGLGKTHLLHAIGNEIVRTRPGTRARYVTCEQFVNDVVGMLAHGRRADDFRSTYRDRCDVLLVDDVQFLANKDKSQIEFFNVFNSLYGMRRQIVLSCDRYPRDIAGLADRLQSRFQWGLVVDIEQPDLETRVAILQRKADETGMYLSLDVAMLVATHIKSNVRELEGALTRLKAYHDVTGGDIDVASARAALGSLLCDTPKRLSIDHVMKTVASYYNVTVRDLKGAARKRAISTPRHVAMFLAKKMTSSSYPYLGDEFGGRDHTTVLAAVQKIERLVKDETSEMAQNVAHLRRVLEQ